MAGNSISISNGTNIKAKLCPANCEISSRRMNMTRHLTSLAFLAGLAATANAHAVELSISCSALGQEYEICKQGVEAWAKKTGNTVRIVSTPNSATERLALYQQLLAAGAPDVDVFQIDVVWSGILGQHFMDLTEKAKNQTGQHFE